MLSQKGALPMIQPHQLLSCLALAIALAGCSGANNPTVNYPAENVGLDPLDQVIFLSSKDHQILDNAFLAYLQEIQGAGDDANWQARPYDHYVTENGFK
jgi:hypothetical protein